jgi:basic membrane protein A
MKTPFIVALAAAALAFGCKKDAPTASNAAPASKQLIVGLVTDVGGRGDQSFNDSALRGLELWAAGQLYAGGSLRDAKQEEVDASIPPELKALHIAKVGIKPIVLQSKAQEDYEPNVQLLVDQGAALVVGVGFMMENAVEAVAKRNPNAKLLLIDSPILNAKGEPTPLPNVRSVIFHEEQGSYLVGALAGLTTKSGSVGFVGGMEIPLIKKFEAGFRAGLQNVNPAAASSLRVTYTGSFDNVGAGKQVGQDLLAKGVDVIFHAAGTDGLGVIQAAKEARTAKKEAYVIGVDSDQWHVAPDAVLSSMVKRVDLAVYQACKDLVDGKWSAGEQALGLKEGGVTYAEVRAPLPNKTELVQKVEALRQRIVAGEISVPSRL